MPEPIDRNTEAYHNHLGFNEADLALPPFYRDRQAPQGAFTVAPDRLFLLSQTRDKAAVSSPAVFRDIVFTLHQGYGFASVRRHAGWVCKLTTPPNARAHRAV